MEAVDASTTAAAAEHSPIALYVGDLAPDVGEEHLVGLFSSIGELTSVRVCKDSATGVSLGYGYVNYISIQDAISAIEKLNHTPLNGKPIRLMWSRRDPNARSSGIGNVFVKNLSSCFNNGMLYDMFSKFGTILSCKVATDETGRSKGFGFVQFDSQEPANSAIQALHGSSCEGKIIYVANFVKKSDRLPCPDAQFTNLYMKNLDQDITEELIKLKFSEFGKISSVSIAKDDDGNSKGFGFVNFETHDSAKRAMEAMNGLQLGTNTLYVARAQKKAERLQILRRSYEEKKSEQMRKYMASNVYVKNLVDVVDDHILRDRFSEFGNITSSKVMLDDKGRSKGFGFVCYSSPEDANKAVNNLHGCMFHGKPLYVSIAQRKEERRAQLQLQYAQRLSGSPAAVMPPAYTPLYYTSSAVVAQVPPRDGLMYHQPFGLSPGWRPNGFVAPSRPTYQAMPFPAMPNTSRQYRQNRGRTNGNRLLQSGQPNAYLPQWHHPANHSLNGGKDFITHQRPGQINYLPNGRPVNNASLTSPGSSSSHGTEMLSTMLAAATPQQQKQILGEHLFPLVENLKFDLAAKITGMLLEMDNSELLLLVESPEALAAKVEEAVQVLKDSQARVAGAPQERMHSNYLATHDVAVN
ncbi:polyadenylate-binding protein 7 [Curcuma longa]|uniref:polyadenylate-binding protein 7 n=1 Tax=Curcuma longa TaxID=136217 RepID=UPI003D9DBA5C